MAPGFTPFPFPRPLFEKFVRENQGGSLTNGTHCTHTLPHPHALSVTMLSSARTGYFPVRIEALPEGTCIHTRIPVYQVGRRLLFQPFSEPANRTWACY